MRNSKHNFCEYNYMFVLVFYRVTQLYIHSYIHIFIHLLVWLTGCNTSWSKKCCLLMASTRIQSLLIPWARTMQLLCSTCWNPKEVGANASEVMELLARWGHTGTRQKLHFSVLLYRIPTEVYPRLMVSLPNS